MSVDHRLRTRLLPTIAIAAVFATAACGSQSVDGSARSASGTQDSSISTAATPSNSSITTTPQSTTAAARSGNATVEVTGGVEAPGRWELTFDSILKNPYNPAENRVDLDYTGGSTELNVSHDSDAGPLSVGRLSDGFVHIKLSADNWYLGRIGKQCTASVTAFERTRFDGNYDCKEMAFVDQKTLETHTDRTISAHGNFTFTDSVSPSTIQSSSTGTPSVSEYLGYWTGDFGARRLVLVDGTDGVVSGAYETNDGVVTGMFQGDKFVGRWCEIGRLPEDHGTVEFQFVGTGAETAIRGRWKYASETEASPWHEGWDLQTRSTEQPPNDMYTRAHDTTKRCR